jgi:hypothetical protein
MVIHGITADEVDVIVTATKAADEATFQELLNYYCEVYWNRFTTKAQKLAWELWNSGKLYQPRVDGLPYPSIVDGIWSDKEPYPISGEFCTD